MSTTIVKGIFRHARETPLLTADEEIELGRSIQSWLGNESRIELIEGYQRTESDRQLARVGQLALRKMIGSNLRLVISITRKRWRAYEKQHSFDDLMQAGCLGLDRAARRYDPTRGYRFSTYATDWVKQQINLYHEENSRGVRLPAHQYTKHGQVRRAIRRLKQDGGTPSIAEIAAAMGETPDHVSSTLQLFARESSLDMLIPGTDFCLMDNLPDPNAKDVERSNLYEIVRTGIEQMPDDMAEVLILSFFRGMSMRQIAEQKGERQAIVQYRRKKAIGYLRGLISV